MKAQDFSRFFRPLNVLIAGALGGGILSLMFSPYFPVNCNNSIMTFFCVPEFSVVFFLMGILWALMTIFLLPGWGMFIWLLRRNFTEKDKRFRSQELVRLIAAASIIAVISYVVFQSLGQFSPEAQSRWLADVPKGVQRILGVHSVYFFLVILPYVLGMSLLNSLIREISTKIRAMDNQSEHDQAFHFISHLIVYRRMLQLFLIVSGIMLSMFPLIAVAMRSVLIAIDPEIGKFYPVSYVIFQGVIFTMLLLFIYVPTNLDLSVVGRQIRDVVCPLNSLNDLKDTVEKRKTLDSLLQTEGSFATNLRSTLLPLSPLISSLLVLLGIKF